MAESSYSGNNSNCLTAARTSKKSDPLASGAPNIASLQPGSSSSMDVPSSSINKDVESWKARPLVAYEIIEESKSCERPVKENIEVGDASSSKVVHAEWEWQWTLRFYNLARDCKDGIDMCWPES